MISMTEVLESHQAMCSRSGLFVVENHFRDLTDLLTLLTHVLLDLEGRCSVVGKLLEGEHVLANNHLIPA